jgi:uncharacterized protein
MSIEERIAQFLSAPAFAVAGASSNRDKYGNKVLRCYLQNGKTAIPVNPREQAIEGIPCVARRRRPAAGGHQLVHHHAAGGD